MSDIPVLVLQFQLRSIYLQHLIQAEATKEYKADWLKNTDTVIRDGTGKFAKKGASIVQSITDTTAILKQGLDLTTDTIQSLVKDPEFRKRAGIATGLPMAKLISNLAAQARLNPKLIEKLDEWIASATKEFADQYGDDKNPMAQAIRNSNLAQPPKDASFNEKMEFRVAQYAAYKEALENPEDFSISKRDELIGKAASAAIPIGISLAIALGFEVAIPLFLAQGVNWGTILSSVAIGEAADFAVQKGLDKLEINNPAVRIGASMVAGILAGGLVTGVNNTNKRLTKDLTEKELEEIAKKEIATTFKQSLNSANSQKFPWQDFTKIASIIEKEGILNEEAVDSLNPTRYVVDPVIGDRILDCITKLKKFHKPPVKRTAKQIDSMLQTGDYIEMYRGINSNSEQKVTQMFEEFKNGKFYQGSGVFGQGTYVAASRGTKASLDSAKKTAISYADTTLESAYRETSEDEVYNGLVMRMLLPKKAAKVIDLEHINILKEKIDEEVKDMAKRLNLSENTLLILEKIKNDPGYLAAIFGYDGVRIRGSSDLISGFDKEDYLIILNRGILVIQDDFLKVASKPIKETERLAREEAERLAKEEAERLAREEAERLAKENAEMRLAIEKAEREAEKFLEEMKENWKKRFGEDFTEKALM